MSTNILEGKWDDIEGLMQQSWEKLTEEDLLDIKKIILRFIVT